MKVRIADTVHLVAPLAPGEDLKGGDEVEVPDAIGAEWILRGYATESREPRAESRGRTQSPMESA